MNKKLNNIFKILLLSFIISIFFIPLPSKAQIAPLTNCSVVSFAAPGTAQQACSQRQQVVSDATNCDVAWSGLTPNETCCCTKGIPAPAQTYSCTWRIKSTTTNPNDPSGHSTVAGGCYDSESTGTDCDPSSKPSTNSGVNSSKEIICCCPGPIADKPKFVADIILPELSIKIDTVKLTEEIYCDNEDGTGNCYYPWIAEYINGIYKYGFGVAGILAAIMLMAGGIIWLISAGDASKIGQAKDIITGSVIGLIILSTSYIILNTINPNLNILKNISLKMVDRITADEVKNPDDQKENPYQEGCDAARKGDFSVCEKYSNTPPGTMKDIPGTNQKATELVVNKYLAAMECVKQKNGGKSLFTVNEGWRSPATQIRYYNDPKMDAARPCCSNHGKGTALDLKRLAGAKMTWEFNDVSGLTSCMNAQGLFANLKGANGDPDEPWHWSPSGR